MFKVLFFACVLFLQGALCASQTPKVLILIITSEDPLYCRLQEVWRSYMTSDPEHVEAYFLRADPTIHEPCVLVGDTLWAKTDENFIPGITLKTLYAMEYMLPRLHEFDYVVRTNSSSFYILPRLLDYLKTLPKERCYAAYIDSGTHERAIQNWGAGAGIYLSRDVVELFVAEKEAIFADRYLYDTFDDVFMSYFFQSHGILLRGAHRFHWYGSAQEWDSLNPQIPDNAFHIRVKSYTDRITNDLYVQEDLLKRFYPAAVK